MKHIDITKFYGPEYYMDEDGLDVRVAMARVNDFVQTMGDAGIALIYSSEEEHTSDNIHEVNIVRRIHLRHAIIDLNNSFDLLLQIPWIMYRYWKLYNSTGVFYNSRDRRTDVHRNSDDWVDEALERCSSNKCIKCLEYSATPELVRIGNTIRSFRDTFIFNESKAFTVRDLANGMKHKSAIRFSEFNQPYNFTINTQHGKLNPSDNNMEVQYEVDFWNLDKEDGEENPDGKLIMRYTDDLYLDINYHNGDHFRASDYLDKRKTYSLNQVYEECSNFHDELVEVFNSMYEYIDGVISMSPLFQVPETRKAANTINLDKYFKVSDDGHK